MTNKEAAEIIANYDVNGCGYCHQGGDEVKEAIEMAIAALKAQEPRVMSLDEIDAAPEHYMEYYTESLYEPNLRIARIQYDGVGHMCMIRGTRYDIREDMYDYGKTWRCWTSRPTYEQRKAVKWND